MRDPVPGSSDKDHRTLEYSDSQLRADRELPSLQNKIHVLVRLSEFTFGGLSELFTHAVRGSVAKTPYFLETISCLALITGESG
jgi:hypothetical protein